MSELDTAVLTKDIPSARLKSGDVGAVVHLHAQGSAYEVEFVAADGRTIALLTLSPADIRPMRGGEILHVRELATS